MKKISKKKFGKRILSMALSLTMMSGLASLYSIAANDVHKEYTRLYDYESMKSQFLNSSAETIAEYPNGSFMFPVSSAEMKMENLYAIEIFREGGTAGEASITVKTVDLTAEYGNDYEIFLDTRMVTEAVEGEANPYYDIEEYSFIATPTHTETMYASNNDENTMQVREDTSDYNDYVLENLMPTSSEFTLEFADGENSKTIYIQTYKPEEVTDTLEFTLNLCNPVGGQIGVQTSASFSIIEEREIPPTYLEISDTQVNPESDVAYITVKRTGNMGTKGEFSVRTEADTAKVNEAYTPVNMSLEFLPGMSEIKVPVNLLEGAENNTAFNVYLEDIEIAQSEPQQAAVNLTDTVAKESEHITALTSSEIANRSAMVNKDTGSRNVRIIDALQFSQSHKTDRGSNKGGKCGKIGGDDSNRNDFFIKFNNGAWAYRENAISAKSNEKIDFTGVKSITVPVNYYSGSCKWDHHVFYISDDDLFTNSSGPSEFNRFDSLDGFGLKCNMTNVSEEPLYKSVTLDPDKAWGEKYLFMTLFKGDYIGAAEYSVYNRGTSDLNNNIRLFMQDYNISIIEPEQQDIYVNGTLLKESPAKNHQLVDPAASNKKDNNKGTSFTIYRDETTSISANIDSKYNGLVRLKGIYFCESGNLKNKSGLYQLNSDSFTLTSEILKKYRSYFKDNKIVIQPVYEVSDANLSVIEYDNTSTTGMKFDIPSASDNKGYVYYNNAKLGTISWTKSTRSGNKYKVADTLEFKFEYAENVKEKLWDVSYSVRNASTKQNLSSADIVNVRTGTDTANIQLKDAFTSVVPEFSMKDTSARLLVKNPGNGDFSGKNDTKYQKLNNDNSMTISGYVDDATSVNYDFKEYGVGEILAFTADPSEGYRAKWSYTDSSSRKTKVYYGNSFFFMVQNAYEEFDNTVTLEFEKVPEGYSSHEFHGQTLIQEGSILHPPINDTSTYTVAKGAQISVGKYLAVSDDNGEFVLETAPGEEKSEIAEIYMSADETHRAMVFYNNQFYLCDLNMKDFIETNNPVQIKMDYKTVGVTPTSISAVSANGTAYGDTITLVSGESVKFNLIVDNKGQKSSKPFNYVTWTIENEDGIKSSHDQALTHGQTAINWSTVPSEAMKQGDKLYVELKWHGYLSNGDETSMSYGKFDTGYNFAATTAYETITYAPDLGAPENAGIAEVPVIGKTSPTISFKGFTPIINSGSTIDEMGREINTITIGLSFGAFKNELAETPEWKTASAKDKLNLLQSKLNAYDAARNAGDLPKNAQGPNLPNSLNMKSAVNLSFSISLCYQANYFVGETGEWNFVNTMLILGAGGNIRISVPFVLLYLPCFAYVNFSANYNAYFNYLPKDGSVLMLDELDDRDKIKYEGMFKSTYTIGFGVGVGYDGLISGSGGVDATFGIDLYDGDLDSVKGTYSIGGNITVELLFLKKTWRADLVSGVMFDTSENIETVARRAAGKAGFNDNILKNTKIKDMIISSAEAYKPNRMLRAAVIGEEKVVEPTTTMLDPEIISIGNGKYFIAATATDIQTDTNNILHYYIYDEATNEIIESDGILKKAVTDNYGIETTQKLEELTNDYLKIDYSPKITDCGDDILIVWNKCMISTDGTENHKLLNSVGISSIYYNKETGKFHDYRVIVDSTKKNIYVSPKAAYNSVTDTAQIFYQSINTENLTADTTLEELQTFPTTLNTSYATKTNTKWSESKTVSLNEKYLKYFDVTSYEDKIMLSYVASDSHGFTLESVDEFEVEEDFDTSAYGTTNSLCIQQFNVENNTLKSSNPIRITGDDFISANPEFVTVNADNASNTLLFFKCNGMYAYQNITNILTNGSYTDADGYQQLAEDCLEPYFITNEEDHTINDDFSVYSDTNGNIYALWTTSESNQQQIWARQFVFNKMDTITETSVLDENGMVKYDENGEPVVKALDKPVYILNGIWGGKTYLTENGINGTNSGKYKGDFSAVVVDNSELLTVFNAFDLNVTGENDDVMYENNMLVIAKYDTAPVYNMPDSFDAVYFSNEYPRAGETIDVTCQAKNNGVKSGRNVDITLYVNGKPYSTVTEDIWYASETKEITFSYTHPEGVKADEVSMYYTVTENNVEKLVSDTFTLKQGAKLELTTSKLIPVRNITEENKNAKFFVNATVKNVGNEAYAGGDFVKLVNYDASEAFNAMNEDYTSENPVYTFFGKEVIAGMETGSSKEVKFVSDDVPESLFTANPSNTASLECIISDKSEADWKTRNADESISIISEFHPGITQMPVAKTVKSIELSDMTIEAGSKQKLEKNVTPAAALIDNKVTYKSSDESIATVNEFGVVTALKTGEVVITAEVNGIKSEAKISVTEAQSCISGDANHDGTVNVRDCSYIAKILAENKADTLHDCADFNDDGKINVRDASAIASALAAGKL